MAQQAAEKALKAFLYAEGEEHVFGHSVAELLKKAKTHEGDFEKVRKARILDKYYIPTRYPNGLPGGVPYEVFDEDDGKKAVGLASDVIDIVRMKFKERDA